MAKTFPSDFLRNLLPQPPSPLQNRVIKKQIKLMGHELLSEAASLEPEVSEREEKKTHLIISVQKRVCL